MSGLSTKKNVFFGGGFIALLILFTFIDLAISKSLFNIRSPFGNLFAAFGETPGFWVALFSAAALVVTRTRTNKVLSIIQLIGFGALWLLLAAMAAYMPMGYIDVPRAFMAIGVVYAAAAMILALRLGKAEREALRRAALVGLLLLVAAILIVNIVKIFWGRPRMRIMTDPDRQFTRWFLPQGIAANDEYKSFPSGHTADAAVIIWITLLPSFIPGLRTRGAKITLNCIAYAWIILVMVSRIIMGAHFASDTLMGGGITLCSFYWLKRWIVKPQL
jgi:membrane-associated phospholipid phosphatase